jgi:hypothetical protein
MALASPRLCCGICFVSSSLVVGASGGEDCIMAVTRWLTGFGFHDAMGTGGARSGLYMLLVFKRTVS